MKKVIYSLILLVIICSLSLMLLACNDNKVEEQNPPKPEEPMTEEEIMMKKIHDVYSSHNIDPQIVRDVNTLAVLTSISYTIENAGPIGVVKAKLNGEDVTLLTLSGTEFVEGQATTIEESQLAAFGKDNDYLKAALRLFDDGTIPQNKPVVITGISLGGMIAQQLIGKVSSTHEIAAVITFGSPITKPLDRQGVKVVRFADSHDIVPVLGESMLFGVNTTALDASEKIVRTSDYRGPIEPHALSYIEANCWDDVDFLGDENKTNVLELTDSMTFYAAPKTANEAD